MKALYRWLWWWWPVNHASMPHLLFNFTGSAAFAGGREYALVQRLVNARAYAEWHELARQLDVCVIIC